MEKGLSKGDDGEKRSWDSNEERSEIFFLLPSSFTFSLSLMTMCGCYIE